jgi:membrane protein DedA with SNARE-associated domain
MVETMIDHVTWLLFVWVLGNQAGLPVPVVPSLLLAGALARGPRFDFTAILAVVVAASLAADLGWYSLGRWRGAQILDGLRRVFPRRRTPVERVTMVFRAHPVAFLLGARFLPELNPLAAGLAGASGVGLARYVACATGSALAWAGAWVGLGFLLGEGLAASPALFGTTLPVVVGGGLVIAAGSAIVLLFASRIAERALSLAGGGLHQAASSTPRTDAETLAVGVKRAGRTRGAAIASCGRPFRSCRGCRMPRDRAPERSPLAPRSAKRIALPSP